jgi:hypothetical protein
MMDSEINLGEFLEAVSISLGSTVALRIKEDHREEMLEETLKRVRTGFDVAKKMKPAADLLRSRGIRGVQFVIIQRELK